MLAVFYLVPLPLRDFVCGGPPFFLQPGAWEKGEETGMMNIDEHSQSTIKRRRTQELCFILDQKMSKKKLSTDEHPKHEQFWQPPGWSNGYLGEVSHGWGEPLCDLRPQGAVTGGFHRVWSPKLDINLPQIVLWSSWSMRLVWHCFGPLGNNLVGWVNWLVVSMITIWTHKHRMAQNNSDKSYSNVWF